MSFKRTFSSWTTTIASNSNVDWAEQLRVLNDIADLITSRLSLEDICSSIYLNVNQLMDAYQFGVGLYDEGEGVIQYKGIVENGVRLPDFSVAVSDDGRLASWCIRNEQDIFMNDVDKEFGRYVPVNPLPRVGIHPKAALYATLKVNSRIAGVIVVRTIHTNVYQAHHLHILKTVGNFVVRALELAKLVGAPFVQGAGRVKEWRWNNEEFLGMKSKKSLLALTQREKSVLFLLIGGLPNRTIAQRLFISPDTVKSHTLNIYRKMGVANRSSAVVKAVELGWIV